ncbi:PadR family transcriptional regulator [Acidocella sp.]|uniref:PadR family transcriptional regulator n=1 Tax=Acidocella sp. TaxID=50710 RepID=UPI0026183E04|nr:PadR family transcriptional regulator [Acidocella sp.]
MRYRRFFDTMEVPRHRRRFMRLERRHGRHSSGGRHRVLEHGDLRVLVLYLIAEAPRHGYELIKAIEDLTGGAYAPSPGVIYPTLTMLEELGQAVAETSGTKRLFTITAVGKEALDASGPALQAMLARLPAGAGRDAVMPIRRAMENLKTALRMKLGGQAATPETVRKATDMIDDLVRKIEAL